MIKFASLPAFQSPIGTQKTGIEHEQSRARRRFQSPIGTQKTILGSFCNFAVYQFQSPIGTQKTFERFEENLRKYCFNPL